MVWKPAFPRQCVQYNSLTNHPYEEISCILQESEDTPYYLRFLAYTYQGWEYDLSWRLEAPSWRTVIWTVVASALLMSVGKFNMLSRPAFTKTVMPLATAWNLIWFIVNLIGFLRMLPLVLHNFSEYSLHDNLCGYADTMWTSGTTGLWGRLWIYLKIIEVLVESILVVLLKQPCGLLPWFNNYAYILIHGCHLLTSPVPGGAAVIMMHYGTVALLNLYLLYLNRHPQSRRRQTLLEMVHLLQTISAVVVVVSTLHYWKHAIRNHHTCHANAERIRMMAFIWCAGHVLIGALHLINEQWKQLNAVDYNKRRRLTDANTIANSGKAAQKKGKSTTVEKTTKKKKKKVVDNDVESIKNNRRRTSASKKTKKKDTAVIAPVKKTKKRVLAEKYYSTPPSLPPLPEATEEDEAEEEGIDNDNGTTTATNDESLPTTAQSPSIPQKDDQSTSDESPPTPAKAQDEKTEQDETQQVDHDIPENDNDDHTDLQSPPAALPQQHTLENDAKDRSNESPPKARSQSTPKEEEGDKDSSNSSESLPPRDRRSRKKPRSKKKASSADRNKDEKDQSTNDDSTAANRTDSKPQNESGEGGGDELIQDCQTEDDTSHDADTSNSNSDSSGNHMDASHATETSNVSSNTDTSNTQDGDSTDGGSVKSSVRRRKRRKKKKKKTK